MKSTSKKTNNFLGDSEGHPGELPRYALEQKDKDAIVAIISRIIQQEERVRFSFLHGSFLQDMMFRDIDVAVYCDEDMTEDEVQDLCTTFSVRFTADTSFPVDFNSLNFASLPFCYDATKGRALTWHDREELYQFREKTWIEYMDFFPILKENLADLLE